MHVLFLKKKTENFINEKKKKSKGKKTKNQSTLKLQSSYGLFVMGGRRGVGEGVVWMGEGEGRGEGRHLMGP